MENKIKELLRKIGVSKSYIGYRYLVDAVMLVSEDPGRLKNMRRDILLPISAKYGASVSSVEGCLYVVKDVILKKSRSRHPEPIPKKLSSKELIQNLCIYVKAEE